MDFGATSHISLVPSALEGLGAEAINQVLELLVAPLQASLPQPTEVVLHDLRRVPNTVRAIAGNVTGRSIGDPPTDRLLERIAAGDVQHQIGYRSQLSDGRVLQSTTIIYSDQDGRPVAALCLNADVSAWVALRASMDQFVLGRNGSSATNAPSTSSQALSTQNAEGGEYFAHSVEDLTDRLLETAIAAVGVPLEKMRKEHKVQVVAELDRRGFFLVKQAAETAATALGVTRFTIYNYLNQSESEEGQDSEEV